MVNSVTLTPVIASISTPVTPRHRAAAWISTAVDAQVLRRPFGVYLLAAGIYILLQKPTKP